MYTVNMVIETLLEIVSSIKKKYKEWNWILIVLAILLFVFWIDASVRKEYENASPEKKEWLREEYQLNNRPDL